MAQFIDEGINVKYIANDGSIRRIIKTDFGIKVSGNNVIILENGKVVDEVSYLDSSNPVATGSADLADQIDAFLESAAAAAGGATEAKQDSAITELQSLVAKDFATQTTLVTLGTEVTSAAVKTAVEAKTRVTAYISTSASASVSAGAQEVSIFNNGAGAGTVKTVSLPAGISLTFKANGNDTLDAIAYDATGTTFLITTVV